MSGEYWGVSGEYWEMSGEYWGGGQRPPAGPEGPPSPPQELERGGVLEWAPSSLSAEITSNLVEGLDTIKFDPKSNSIPVV